MIGYNETEVKSAINNVKAGYGSLISALTTKNQAEFVDAFGNIWACEQAQSFFNAYKTDISNLVEEINKVYQSIVDSMNQAAFILASRAGSTWANNEIVTVQSNLSIESIKDNLNGVKGIDLEKTPDVLGELDTILNELKTGLDATKAAVNSSGFVGGGMQENLVNSINKISEEINQAFNNIKSSVNTSIQETIDAYSSDVTNISTGFTSN